MLRFSKILIPVLFTAFIVLSGCIFSEKNQTSQTIQNPKICFESNSCISVELADSTSLREKGLMDRAKLDENAGMLFVFESETIPSFWMKNMNFPLDLIWIDSNYQIAMVSRDVPPCKTENCPLYSPENEIKFVLEVNSGFFEKNNLKIGQKISVSG